MASLERDPLKRNNMKYSEFKSLLDEMRNLFVPGVKFDNHNIGGDTIHTVSENDRLAMSGDGSIVLCVNGILGRYITDKDQESGRMIIVYKNKTKAEILS